MNLSDTDWHTMSSTDDTELDGFVDLGVQQIVPIEENGRSLDVILTDQLLPVLDCVVKYSFRTLYYTNGRYLSDHEPFCLTLEFQLPENQNQRIVPHLSYASLDWELLHQEIMVYPLYPFCYSNVNFLLSQWCEWIFTILRRVVPRPTSHRAKLAPWVSQETSNLLKKN